MSVSISPLDLAWVGLGGGSGSLLRWWVGRLVGEHRFGHAPDGQQPRPAFPLATLLINVSGAFAIGFLSVLFSVHWRDRFGTALGACVLTGLLGGYTTFSSMQLDAVKLARDSKLQALFYLLLSVLLGLAAAALGAALGRAQG
jgi:CrcB protein